MTNVIEVVQDVALDRPVMVVALEGWVDAGNAGESAIEFLDDQMSRQEHFAKVDLAEVSDLQSSRPMVELVDGVTREITWPKISFIAGKAGVDVIVVRGPEPSLRWREFAAETVELAREHNARMVVTLGGMPAPVSHRRPMRVLSTASSRSVAQEVEPVRPDYTGPTGAQTAVQVAAGAAGISAIGLWGQVPHYLAGTVSPVASRALLSRLREIAGVEVDLRPLDEQADVYQRQVEETVNSRSDLEQLVEQLDAQMDDLPSGDELASEIEEFLRGDQ